MFEARLAWLTDLKATAAAKRLNEYNSAPRPLLKTIISVWLDPQQRFRVKVVALVRISREEDQTVFVWLELFIQLGNEFIA